MTDTEKRGWLGTFFSKPSKDVFIFLFFIAMATVFWVIQKMEDQTTVQVAVPVKLTNIPKDVIIATELPKELQITVRAKGNELLPFFWSPRLDTISIDFKKYDTHEATDITILAPTVIQQMLKEKLPSHSTITQLLPDTLYYAYNRGVHKKCPVKLRGSLSTSNQYNLDGYAFTPDSVDVYAPEKILDTLRAAYTEVTMLQDMTESTQLRIPLMHSRSIRFIPDTVSLDINVDILTRQSIEVYVQGIDFPEGKELRTLPATATLTYLVSAAQAKTINTNLFQVAVSYNDIKNSSTNKCKPHIISMPGGISGAFITPQQVDFIIEDINTSHMVPVRPKEL